MAEDLRPDEVCQQYVTHMPDQTGTLFHALWQEVTSLYIAWRTFVTLFGTSEERVRLLTYCAKDFFLILQWILWDDVLLRIARLTDPLQSAGNLNASLHQLAHMLSGHAPADLLETIGKELNGLDFAAKPIRVHRHKRLAHTDLTMALDPDAEVTPGITRRDIQSVLELIKKVMNRVEGHFMGSETAYELAIQTGDADTLTFWLEHARKHEHCPG